MGVAGVDALYAGSMNPASLILRPQAAPVVGIDHHLPAVAEPRLQADALRQRFANVPTWSPEFLGDGLQLANRALRPASVLIPLVQREDGLQVLLTRRTDHLRDHAGQISFPGGRAEPDEIHDPVLTALREAQEEVGLAPDRVEVLGCLPTYTTVTAYVVTPVVGLIRPPLTLQVDPSEVAEAFEVPLRFLMTPGHHQRHRHDTDQGTRHFYAMPWRAASAPPERERDYFIWGATAAMLRNLYRFLSA